MQIWKCHYGALAIAVMSKNQLKKEYFIHLGFGAGRALIKEPQKENEIETAIMPLYDVGIKAHFKRSMAPYFTFRNWISNALHNIH